MKKEYIDVSKVANKAYKWIEELEKRVEELERTVAVLMAPPESAKKECEHYWIREISTDCEYCNRCWTRRKYQPQKEPCYCEPKYIYADCPKHGLPKVEGLADRLKNTAWDRMQGRGGYEGIASVARQWFRELVESCVKEFSVKGRGTYATFIEPDELLKRLEK